MPPLVLPRDSGMPRLVDPVADLDAGAGVANLLADFDEDGFSTKEVSVVLESSHQ